jgi:hypothetical protein
MYTARLAFPLTIGGTQRIDLATSFSAHFRKEMFRHEVDENPHPR